MSLRVITSHSGVVWPRGGVAAVRSDSIAVITCRFIYDL